ncbi:MAG: hypothetical protein U9Q98_11260 [Bacteroidota bacterium]|nr:hypothetical protein [Bacteroidota bacterium]
MKKNIYTFMVLISLSLMSYYPVKAQGKLKLLNGKELHIEKYMIDTSASMFYYKLKLPSGKLKKHAVMTDDIFSLIDSTGLEQILYTSSDTSDLSVNEMRHYVKGYGTANREHEPWWAMAGGFAMGAGGMMVSKNPFFSPLIPVAYVGSIALVKPDKSCIVWEHPEFEGDEDFIYAYQRSARNKNMKYAIIGSAEGIVVGALIGILTGYYN